VTSPIRRVAALYDVHGNLPALDAALADVDAAEVDLVIFGGDLALGPMPREVLERIAELGNRARSLRGNCDRLMVEACNGRLPATLPAAVRAPITWAAEQLRQRHRDFLASLPATITIDIASLGAVLFCHATPRSDEEIVTVRTPEERVRTIMGTVRESVVVCGHTHMPFDRRMDGVRVVNAGSVGMPFGEPGAHWLLAGSSLEHRRSEYDVESAAKRISLSGYPDAERFAERHVLHPPTEAAMLAMFEASESAASASASRPSGAP